MIYKTLTFAHVSVYLAVKQKKHFFRYWVLGENCPFDLFHSLTAFLSVKINENYNADNEEQLFGFNTIYNVITFAHV